MSLLEVVFYFSTSDAQVLALNLMEFSFSRKLPEGVSFIKTR